MTGSLFERETDKLEDIMGLSGVISTGQASIVKGHDMTTPSVDYRLIPLSRGQFAKVDLSDYEWVSQHKWTASWDRCTKSFYALRHSSYAHGVRDRVSMHREILALAKGDPNKADHINGDTLDNRRANLRVADRAQNRRNSKLNANNSCGFRGVCLHKGRYEAKISVDGRQKFLGSRTSAHAAYYELYVPAAAKYYGEFAGRE